MPATAHKSRRCFLAMMTLALQSPALQAQEKPPTLKLLTDLAAKLSDGNLPGAVDAFSKTMPGYEDTVANLGALTSQYDVICVIEIREESGDEGQRKADTEWFLQIKSKQDEGPTERRTVPVKIVAQRIKGKWRITAMEPRSLLAPPQVR